MAKRDTIEVNHQVRVPATVGSIKGRTNRWSNAAELGVTFALDQTMDEDPVLGVKRLWAALPPGLVTWSPGDAVMIAGTISSITNDRGMGFMSLKGLSIQSAQDAGEGSLILGEVKTLLGGDTTGLLDEFVNRTHTLDDLQLLRQIVQVANHVGAASVKAVGSDDGEEILGIDELIEAEGAN